MPTARSTAKRPAKGKARGSLWAYYDKRDLSQSGEPGGDDRSSSKTTHLSYVIQKHDATRLHYDLRLEMSGVFKSWAVPKGLPEKTGARSLAIEVEDHPLDYGSFEGTIPAGNYGAGTVMIWDRGAYTVEGGDPDRAYRKGHIHFALVGEKCRGEWTLVRMKPDADSSDKTQWLVIKNHDSSRAGIRKKDRDLSVASGRTLDEIATGGGPQWTSKGLETKTPARRPEKKTPAPRTQGSTTVPDDYVEPMKALATPDLHAKGWTHELKFDGFRAIAVISGGRASLWSRNRKPLSEKFPEVVEALEKLGLKRAVLDGEIVALDSEGRPRFQLLQGLDMSAGERPPVFYYVFDLLRREGRSFLKEPIESRRAELEKILKKSPDELRISLPLRGEPKVLLEQIRRQGLEGLISKAEGSEYEPGRRSGLWQKHRVSSDQEFVIGGYTSPKGGRSHFGALLVGYYQDGELLYAGKVGTGFDAKKLAALHKAFQSALQKECPFSNLPMPKKPRFGLGMTASAMKSVTWLKPKFVGQVRFSEWTREGLLRQPVFLGLREDKNARDVVRETPPEGA